MESNLTQEIMIRIDALAAKLGVASEQLWAIFVQQAHIEGYLQLTASLVAFTAATIYAVWGWRGKEYFKHGDLTARS